MGFVLFTALAGAVAGLTAFALMEPFAPTMFFDPRWGAWGSAFMALLGALVGCTLGALQGRQQGSAAHAWRGLGAGLLLGGVGGSVGAALGGALSGLFFGDVLTRPGIHLTTLPARFVAFVPIGATIGLAAAIPSRSWRRARFALIGGALGAGLGALAFDFASLAMSPLVQAVRGGDEVGTTGRGILAVATGGGVGLFTSLIIRATRTAWVRRVYGRNEFKEWIVDARQTTIGRSELAHIPILDDPAVARQHAVIELHGGTYYLTDCGSPSGTFVNGTPIRQVPLFSGATIQVGSTRLEFVMREGSAPARAAEALRQQWQTQVQTPAGTQPVAMATAAGAPFAVPASPGQPTIAAAPLSVGQPTIAAPFAVVPGGWVLVALGGPMAGQRTALAGRLEVGRDLPGLPLAGDAMASRRHALLEAVADGVAVTDLGSTNGTFLNGRRIAQGVAKSGDVLRIGGTDFRVERA
ncbi:MAG: FHA domain-containing protein [Fimbriimonadales bacterium]|nr:FHA domain-containing protein [Fimbriimonadales bacterium]